MKGWGDAKAVCTSSAEKARMTLEDFMVDVLLMFLTVCWLSDELVLRASGRYIWYSRSESISST
jgi:hypothetical protein